VQFSSSEPALAFPGVGSVEGRRGLPWPDFEELRGLKRCSVFSKRRYKEQKVERTKQPSHEGFDRQVVFCIIAICFSRSKREA
jgi:hypothetical protein